MTTDNIQRLINNQKFEHSGHAFAANRYGMGDFNQLYPVLRKFPAQKLAEWMRMIDAVRDTHRDCAPCFAKLLAYSIPFTQDQSPDLSAQYQQIYDHYMARVFVQRPPRDIMAEVMESLGENQTKALSQTSSKPPPKLKARWARE